MFSNDKTVAGAQKIMLEILLAVHKVCEENHITYFLNAGTLLGALRHGGFIPWDDDMDIAMPRKDYEKFLEIAPEALPKDLFLQTRDTDPAYQRPTVKIRKNGTLLIETGETGNEKYHHGIFIDIFPYDYYKYEWFLRWMNWGSRVRDRKNRYKKGTLKRLLVTLYTNYLLAIPAEILIQTRKYLIKHREYFVDENYEFMSNGLEMYRNRITRTKDIMPVKYAEGIFEGYGFCVPRNPEKFMTDFYGDYMKLPPENERITHAKLIKLEA